MIYTITGGTGTFGQAFVNRLLTMDFIEEIRIFSRDEAKQWDMKKELNDPRLKYYLGDVRDQDSMYKCFAGADIVFHAAAMKHVWSCEEFPVEALRTNVLGTDNAVSTAIDCEVQRFILLSSDKAVFPVGAMGMTKALAEKVALANSNNGITDIIITRFGNIIDSRGNVIDAWHKAMNEERELVLYEGAATRYFMTTEQAMDVVVSAVMVGSDGEIVIPDCKAALMIDLLEAYSEKYNYHKMKALGGLTTGEKLHEWLDEDRCSKHADKYTKQELMKMI